MARFSELQCVFIRERLRYFFNYQRNHRRHHYVTGRGYSVKELIFDIVYTDERFLARQQSDTDDTKPYDYRLPIKDDGLGRFLNRKQDRMNDIAMLMVANFLERQRILTQAELEQIREYERTKLPIKSTSTIPHRANLFPFPAEYVGVVQNAEYDLVSTLAFSCDGMFGAMNAIYRVFRLEHGRSALNRALRSSQYKYGELFDTEILVGICLPRGDYDASIIAFDIDYNEMHMIHVTPSATNIGSIFIDRTPDNHVMIGNIDQYIFDLYNNAIGQEAALLPRDKAAKRRNGDDLSRRRLKTTNNIKKLELAWLRKQTEMTDTELNREFLLAAQNGDLIAAIQWLVFGADIQATDPKTGNTALHFAAISSNFSLYRVLANDDPLGMIASDSLNILSDELDTTINLSSAFELAITNAPICAVNKEGRRASACVSNVQLNATARHEKERLDFFLKALSLEAKKSGLTAHEFVASLFENNLLAVSNVYQPPLPEQTP